MWQNRDIGRYSHIIIDETVHLEIHGSMYMNLVGSMYMNLVGTTILSAFAMGWHPPREWPIDRGVPPNIAIPGSIVSCPGHRNRNSTINKYMYIHLKP
jgi:hypothetical protein